MHQEEFQRSFDHFHQLVVTIRPASIFYSDLKDINVTTIFFSYFLQLEEKFLSEMHLNSSVAGNLQLHLEPSRKSTKEPFCEHSYRLLAVNYFRKNVPS